MCLQETSDTESYHRVRVIHRRPAALSPTCPMPRRSRYSYNCRLNSTSCSSSSSSSRTGYCSDSDYDCDSDSEAYVCRPRYSRTYYVRPSCERYECRPACSRPSYTTITRTRTRTRETIYPARREVLECEPVRRVCELGRRYRILWCVEYGLRTWGICLVLWYVTTWEFEGLDSGDWLWLYCFWLSAAFFVFVATDCLYGQACIVFWPAPKTTLVIRL